MINNIRFIDLFAGIGGFHLALKNNGGECVFACEIDKKARETYKANHKIQDDIFLEDITKIDIGNIPNHDVLCAGFPCQPFSQAGFKKGFKDTRGSLFFSIVKIINAKKPGAFFLENVPFLLKHNNGKTFKKIKTTLKKMKYSFYYEIISAVDFGVPQNRRRLCMVGFKNDKRKSFTFPMPIKLNLTMSDIFNGDCAKKIGYTLRVGGRHTKINDRRNWDSYIVDGEIKKITPKEGLMMQGFPSDFKFPISENQAMKQLGNSVAVPMIQAISKKIFEYLNHNNN